MLLPGITVLILILALIFSMLGLGGAMVYIPLLHWFGFDFKTVAIPTGLFLNGVTALSAALFYLRSRMVDVRGSVPLMVSSLIGAPLGACFTNRIPKETLILLFSAAMIFAGGRMLWSSKKTEERELMPLEHRIPLMAAGGFLIGMVAGLLGIGGGFLFVPMMLAMGYATKQAAATSAFVVVFSSFSGFAGHLAHGHFDLELMAATTIAVIVGSQIGAKMMKEKMKPAWIKRMFACVLLLVAGKLLWKIMVSA